MVGQNRSLGWSMRILYSGIIVSVFLLSAGVNADPQWGRALCDETEFEREINGEWRDDVTCSTCHDPEFYTRAERRADRYRSLHTWVDSCNTTMSVQWFPDEVDAVTRYLNAEYYQFPAPAPQE